MTISSIWVNIYVKDSLNLYDSFVLEVGCVTTASKNANQMFLCTTFLNTRPIPYSIKFLLLN